MKFLGRETSAEVSQMFKQFACKKKPRTKHHLNVNRIQQASNNSGELKRPKSVQKCLTNGDPLCDQQLVNLFQIFLQGFIHESEEGQTSPCPCCCHHLNHGLRKRDKKKGVLFIYYYRCLVGRHWLSLTFRRLPLS